MHSAFVEVNGVPSRVTTWGKWIEEGFDEGVDADIVLLIAGNPGITGFYRQFLETLHQRTGFHVWCVSHAGHELPGTPSTQHVPEIDGNEELFDLQGQIQHKIEFIKKYVPPNCRLHLLGHSIGAYICTRVLDDASLNARIQMAYLLFPTIENMATTPNGKFYTNVVARLQVVLIFLAHFAALLPRFIQLALAHIVLWLHGAPSVFVAHALEIARPRVASGIMFLANDEMTKVRARDDANLARHQAKLFAYYGRTDGWAPMHFCERLQRDLPGLRAVLAPNGFEHAFVLKHSKEMGIVVADWLTGVTAH